QVSLVQPVACSLSQMVSIDFFTVPTLPLKVLFVFIVREHRRRQVMHFNVTEHPTAAWTALQMVEAFADPGCRSLSAAGSGQHLRQRRSSEDRLAWHERSSHGPAQSVAESIRRTPDRLHPPGVPEPLRDPECQTSEEDAEKLFPLLS